MSTSWSRIPAFKSLSRNFTDPQFFDCLTISNSQKPTVDPKYVKNMNSFKFHVISYASFKVSVWEFHRGQIFFTVRRERKCIYLIIFLALPKALQENWWNFKVHYLVKFRKYWWNLERICEIFEINWWSFAWKFWWNFEENVMKLLEKFDEILRNIWWNFGKKLVKF